jgi:phosphoenolpyruvate carboxykinase (ATP)
MHAVVRFSCRTFTPGPMPTIALTFAIITELAWHGLFIRHLLRRPAAAELDSFTPEWTVINLPSFKADPARHGCRTETVIALNFDEKTVLIGGTAYAGENKKAVFTRAELHSARQRA